MLKLNKYNYTPLFFFKPPQTSILQGTDQLTFIFKYAQNVRSLTEIQFCMNKLCKTRPLKPP